MEGIKVIPLSSLLLLHRPISGTSSLNPDRPITPSTKTLNPTTLLEPSMIIGTLSLLPTNHTSPPHFSFSDDSSSFPCDVINFDFSMIGQKIHVSSWNFIPVKKNSIGGFLEIISWKFVDNSMLSNSTLPLVCNNVAKCGGEDKKGRYCVKGVVESVSPVLTGACKTGGVAESVRCFIVEVGDSGNLVYFSGVVSRWYPAFLRVVGRGVSLSGLRKKLVYIEKDEGRVMYVACEATSVCFSEREGDLSGGKGGKKRVEGRGELGVYVGVVRGVYMHGMVVELDEEVWLLMTDESIVLPHSVRVGAILCARNVHIVNPKFGWGKMVILGACCKTNISTISFSPLGTGCQLVSWSQSLLGKFIESLVFSARLWVLLLVQCFRKKFSGAFTEREILGTKHKEGLVQTYARYVLPPSAFQSRHGVFIKFCKHELCSSASNVPYGTLHLGVPFSNFLSNCNRIWMNSFQKMKNGLEILEECSKVNRPFQETRSSDHSIRRILSSKDIGVSLLGNLKISQATGRLQFIDATGSIDAVIPDLPSVWETDAMYEVIDYYLVIEGRPEMCDQTWMLDDDFFSCRSMFHSIALYKQTELTVYLHFSWSNVSCRRFHIHSCLSAKDSYVTVDPGSFHLLAVVHKYPKQPQFQGDLLISGKCRSFVEVMVLPWNLNVTSSDGAALPTKLSQDELKKCCQNGAAFKRCKTRDASSYTNKDGLGSNFKYFGNESCSDSSNSLSLPHKAGSVKNFSSSSCVQVPCTATVRGIHGQSVAVSGFLCSTQVDVNLGILQSTSLRKVLLEFNSKNMFKYEMLHIGGYYIVKHCAEKCFCDSNDSKTGSKVTITSDIHLWSLSFHFNEVASTSGPYSDPSPGSSPSSKNLCRHYLQNELMLHPCSGVDCGSIRDVNLHFAAGKLDYLNTELQDLKEAVKKLWVTIANIGDVGQQVGFPSCVVGVIRNQGSYSGNILPEGNLISLRGTVVSLHHSDCCLDGTVGDVPLHTFRKEWKGLICLHVLTDGHMLQIGGFLNKHDNPIGLGPGADVTCHRVLALGEQNRFMLTAVSFLTVNSVKKVSSPDSFLICSVPQETIASCSISDMIQSGTSKPRRFRCRVVGVHIVVLERNKNLDKLLSCISAETPIINIPLAGFIVDDGSAQSCCWANGKRAATFLRLQEELPQAGSGRSWRRLEETVVGRSSSTPNSHLDRILKRHGRVTVKNYGSMHDTLSQDLQLSIDIPYGTQDENFLKFIIFSACSSTFWSVVGHVMDSNAVNVIEKYLLEEQMTTHALQNVWATEVCQVNTLAEARALFQDL